MIKAVIFDADGVVIDTHQIYLLADQTFLVNHGADPNPENFDHLLNGVSLEDGTKILQNLFEIQGNSGDLLLERIEIIKNLYKKIGFVPGFLDFFNKIKSNYKVAIATSSNTELFSIADNGLGLHKLFNNHIYFLRDVNYVSKPAPDIYLFAAKQLNSNPSDCLVVEDAPSGILSGKKAGMKVIGLSSSHNRELLKEADQIVDFFNQINLDQI